MRPIRLDYQQRPRIWPALALMLLGALVLGDAALRHAQLSDDLDELKAALRRPAKPVRTQVLTGPDAEKLSAEFAVARRVLDNLTLPWPGLFRAIEAVQDDTVALLGIAPDPQKRLVTITGEAKDYASVLQFVTRLEDSRALEKVHLVNHEIRQEDPQRPFFFTLAASWTPGS